MSFIITEPTVTWYKLPGLDFQQLGNKWGEEIIIRLCAAPFQSFHRVVHFKTSPSESNSFSGYHWMLASDHSLAYRRQFSLCPGWHIDRYVTAVWQGVMKHVIEELSPDNLQLLVYKVWRVTGTVIWVEIMTTPNTAPFVSCSQFTCCPHITWSRYRLHCT